jgi:hypothetical protein
MVSKMNLLIFREKHGDRYFTYSTEEEKWLVACHVAKERLEEGWWYDTTPASDQPDMFRPRAHMSDAERIGYLLLRAEDPNLRKPGVSGAWYRREVYRWMHGRCHHQYEGFIEDRLSDCSFEEVK